MEPESKAPFAALSRAQTINFLKSAARIFATGVNERNFDPSDPFWHLVAPDFQADFAHPLLGHIMCSFEESFAHLKDLIRTYPEHRLDVAVVNVCLADGSMQADVMTILDSTGSPPGQTRQSMISQSWEKRDVGWRCVKYQALKGMAGGSMVGWWGEGVSSEGEEELWGVPKT